MNASHTQDQLISDFLLARAIEDKMLVYLRQGKISKWFSSRGQEAISVAAVHALQPDETIFTMHRNLGVFTTRRIPLQRLFEQFQGKPGGFTQGRDRSFHFGSKDHHIVGMISHLGAQLGVACGKALHEKLGGTGKCVLAFTGDGATSQGDFHEAMNVAAVWELPLITIVERNYWGLSTPEYEQFKLKSFTDKGPGYGMKAVSLDANDLVSFAAELNEIAEEVRKTGQPIMVEARTFRQRGHEEASGTKYYPEGMIEEWLKKDPLEILRGRLDEVGWTDADLQAKLKEHTATVAAAFKAASDAPEIAFDEAKELADLYAPAPAVHNTAVKEQKEMRLIDAIHLGLGQALELWPELILMGQDIAEYGGVFKATDGYAAKFGKDRVRNTPLCESAILGASLGYSVGGGKSMVEMQFADFVSTGFNQIINNLAKIHWRWGQNADVVVRMPTGAGVAAGPFHSQSPEAWFAHTPGLKVVYPAFPNEAKALLLASFNDPNPVLFFEHKALYRTFKEPVDQEPVMIPLGEAYTVSKGTDALIVSYGMGVHWAMDWAERHPDASVEILDLRTLSPLDWPAIEEAATRIGRVLVLQEDCAMGSMGEHIAAGIGERCFKALDAPVKVLSSLNTPVPFHATLEAGYLANSKLDATMESLLSF